jgi:hypothetical protein
VAVFSLLGQTGQPCTGLLRLACLANQNEKVSAFHVKRICKGDCLHGQIGDFSLVADRFHPFSRGALSHSWKSPGPAVRAHRRCVFPPTVWIGLLA